MKYTSKDYRSHLASHRAAMRRPQHDYDAMKPFCKNSTRGRDERTDELVRYASAMGRKWGLLPLDQSHLSAFAVRSEDGSTAKVYFTPFKMVKGRYGPEARAADQDETSVCVDVRFLDWIPEEPTEELLYEAA